MRKITLLILILISATMTAQDIILPSPNMGGGMPLMEALKRRESNRDFSRQELDAQTLSDLLWAAWGFNRGTSKRTAPSSHNRQEISLYVALESGTYIYDAEKNLLKMVNDKDLRSDTGIQLFVNKAPANIIFVADLSKITGKDERGTSETAYANTGFISQNIYLYCASAGLNTVVRAMVNKSKLSEKLGLGKNQIITLCQTVGWPKGTKSVYAPFVEGLESLSYEELRNVMKEKGSPQAISTVNWPQYPYCPGVSFSIARSATHLFVSFLVSEKSIRGAVSEDNGPVYQDSCVEFFVQVPGQDFYYNFETNCIGVMHAAKRKSRAEKAQFPADTMSRIIRYSSLPKEPFEEKFSDDGFKWNVIIGIPFDIIGLDPANLPEKITANFYKCGDNLSDPHFLSWNPIKINKPDFHRTDYFGEIEF